MYNTRNVVPVVKKMIFDSKLKSKRKCECRLIITSPYTFGTH